MYVGLIVRDECEELVKTQASKDEQMDFVTGSRLTCEKFTREKTTHREQD